MTEPTSVPQPLPPGIAAMDASLEPLCGICRASFREPGGVLCAACRYHDEDEDDVVPASVPALDTGHAA